MQWKTYPNRSIKIHEMQHVAPKEIIPAHWKSGRNWTNLISSLTSHGAFWGGVAVSMLVVIGMRRSQYLLLWVRSETEEELMLVKVWDMRRIGAQVWEGEKLMLVAMCEIGNRSKKGLGKGKKKQKKTEKEVTVVQLRGENNRRRNFVEASQWWGKHLDMNIVNWDEIIPQETKRISFKTIG